LPYAGSSKESENGIIQKHRSDADVKFRGAVHDRLAIPSGAPVASDNAARAPAPAAIVIVTAKRLSEAEKRGS